MGERKAVNKPFIEPEKALDTYLSTLLENISIEAVPKVTVEEQVIFSELDSKTIVSEQE
jgi:hypothetical protein